MWRNKKTGLILYYILGLKNDQSSARCNKWHYVIQQNQRLPYITLPRGVIQNPEFVIYSRAVINTGFDR